MSASDQTRDGGNPATLTVIPDANVLIHGRALSELPWAEFERADVEVALVAPVIGELDKLKNQSGRQNRIARQLSTDTRKILTGANPVNIICTKSLTVSKRVVVNAVDQVFHPSLRLDHADQALINYALHMQSEGLDVLLLTDDTICGTTAMGVGLPTKFLPEHWLRTPEPDENAKLKAEITRLTAAEPQISLTFCDAGGGKIDRLNFSAPRWAPLNADEIDGLMAVVAQHCPPATSFERKKKATATAWDAVLEANSRLLMYTGQRYEPATQQEIERYQSVSYPEWLESIRAALRNVHQRLEARTQWPVVNVVGANSGTRPATSVLLRVGVSGSLLIRNDGKEHEAGDGVLAQEDRFELQLPPSPPRGKMVAVGFHRYADILSGDRPNPLQAMASFKPRASSIYRDPDVFYWRSGESDWVNVMELDCQSWRHGQDPCSYPIMVRPMEMIDCSGMVEASVHATNVSKPLALPLPVKFNFADESTFEEVQALVEMLVQHAQRYDRL